MVLQTRVAQASSLGLRLVSFFFLRWAMIPFLPPIAFALFLIYVPSFISSYLTESKYEVVHDEVDLVVKETTLDDKDGEAPVEADGDGEVVAEEVEVQETIVVGEKPVRAWQSLLTGAPTPRSLAISLATLLINLLVVSMVADRVYREHQYTGEGLSFIRVGYVSDTEAKLLIREPDQSKMPITIELHIKNPEPPFDNPLWQTAGGVRWTANDTDFTAVVSIPLKHNKQRTYEWKSSNGHSGEFTSAPKAGRVPEINNGQFTFLATSCILNRVPYNPLDHPLSIPGMRHLAKILPTLQAQFMLFLGDFIYVDVPRWWGKDVSDYRQKYRQVYASPEWASVGQNLSWIHAWDDHEISNDWDHKDTGVYKAAAEPWHLYHVAPNPPAARKAGSLAARPKTTYFEFSQGPASFFLMDTRSYRSENSLPFGSTNKTMLGPEQLEDFIDFLNRPEPKGIKWKIVGSSVPFTKNWHVNTRDTWGGFLAERQKVLEAMWNAASRGVGVVILSGDRHEFAATKFPPPAGSPWPESAAVYEFSASPLNQFYSPIPTYRQTDDEDVKLKYINVGNSKFGVIDIENLSEGDQSSLKYRVYIDGVEAWKTVILSPLVSKTVDGKVKGSFWDRLAGNR